MTALVLLALLLHAAVATHRAAGLLEHDEAISLLAAAGKAARMEALHDEPLLLHGYCVRELQDMLRPTTETGTRDVLRSLSHQDRHPPLYFLILRGLQELGLNAVRDGRLFGTLMFLIAAWCANRWIWPDSSVAAKLLGTAWLLLTPAMVNVATELRQYSIVYLGIVLSIAALVQLATPGATRQTAFYLLAIAPLAMLWSQYGTVVWLGLGWVAAVFLAVRLRERRWQPVAAATIVVVVGIAPLALWLLHAGTASLRAPLPSAAVFYAEIVRPMAQSLVTAWVQLPWSWQISSLPVVLAPALLAVIAVLAFTRGTLSDRLLWWSMLVWMIAWLGLLARSWIPRHAIELKQIGPLIIIPLCLLVRATVAARPPWVRLSAQGILAASLLGLIPGVLVSHRGVDSPRLLTALRDANALLVDVPRRGHLLPLVEKMRPDARLLIVFPTTAIDRWLALEAVLPEDRLLLSELAEHTDPQELADVRLLRERLAASYAEQHSVWPGSRRQLTEYRHRRPRTATPPVVESNER